jgi:hypothetical protein
MVGSLVSGLSTRENVLGGINHMPAKKKAKKKAKKH